MPRSDFEIVGSFNNQRVAGFDAERSINMFEYDDPRGKKRKVLLPTEGLGNREDIDQTGAYRAQFVFKGTMFEVIGNGVYSVDSLLNATLLGTLTTSSGYVGISANTFQVIFVDGVEGWIWDSVALTFTKIVDANFPNKPIDVTMLGLYFIVAQGDSQEFRVSQLNDGSNWTPLASGSVTTRGSNIIALRTLHKKMLVFTSTFTEFWQLSGNGALPVAPIQALLMEYGAVNADCVREGFDKLLFQSQDLNGLGPVMMVTGSQAIPVSDTALDYQIQQFANPFDANGILYRANGLIFYRLNFTTDDHTYVFNVSKSTVEDKKWHEEEMLGGNRHIAQTHAYFLNKNFFGSYLQASRYEVSDTFVTNDGELIRRARIPRMFVPEGYQRIRCNRFQLDLLQGNVEDVGINEAPVVYLSISKDGGQTWGNELPALMGKLGERSFRTLWRKLGVTKRGQAFQLRIQFFEKIPFVILGAAWDYEVLPE